MKKNIKNILVASGVAAVTALAAGAVNRFITKTLMNVAMDRKASGAIEKNREKLMGSKDLSEIMKTAMDAAEALEAKEHETVEIEAFDKIKLVGHWYTCKSPKRIIIAMHGWRSSWSQDFGIISEFYEKNDCCVLYAEQRGHGNSGGEYMGFGLLERYDCLDWLKWAEENTDPSLPIYLCGLSMGAATVLMTAATEFSDRVHGIMADCAFTSPHAIWKHVVQSNLHLPYGLYSAAAKDMCRKRISMTSDEYSCPEALKSCRVPVIFIHGSDDNFVPVEMTYENYKACASKKHLLIVPGADHAMSYIVDKESYESACRKFWREYDREIPPLPSHE